MKTKLMKTRGHMILLFGVSLLLSCASPQKSFKKGKYEKAYQSALKSLKKGQKDRKLKSVLNNSFDKLYEKHTIEAEKLATRNFIEDWEGANGHLDKLIGYYYDGKAYLDPEFDEPMEFVMNDADTLKANLAGGYFDLGDDRLKEYDRTQNKFSAQDAHQFFTKSVYYGYKPNIDTLIERALEASIIYMTIEAYAPYDRRFEWDINRRFDDLESESDGYLTIRYGDFSNNADCNMEIEFSNLRRYVNEDYSTRQFSERIEDGYETRTDTSGKTTRVPIYRDVTGEVTIIREEYTFEWGARVRSYGDSRYCDYNDRRFEEEEKVTRERYQTSGDDRAIPSQYKNDREQPIDEDDIAEDLIDDIYREIRRYYFN